MKKAFLILAAAALLMTSCAPDNLGGNGGPNGTESPAIGDEAGTDAGSANTGKTGGTADNGTNSGMTNGGTDKGTANGGNGTAGTGSDANGTGGVSNGANRRDTDEGTSTVRRRVWNGLRRELPDDTLGDLDGDGMVENRYTERMESPAGAFRPVTNVASTEDAKNFIGANVLSLCRADLPEMAAARVLGADERHEFSDRGGLTAADGVRDVIVSEASDGGDFSITMLRTDGSHTRALSRALGRRVDVDEWHHNADKTVSVTLDDDIVVLSGDREKVDAALLALVRAAGGVYDRIGETRVVTG